MSNSIKWRALLTAGVLLVCLVLLLPTILPDLPGWWKKVLPDDKLRLGLDLKGGMHLVLGVQVDKAVETTTDRTAQELKSTFRKKRLRVSDVKRNGIREIVVTPGEGANLAEIKAEVEQFPNFEIQSESAAEVLVRLRPAEEQRIRQYAIDQGRETIRNRVDQFGVSEAAIIKQGEDQIVVELPGIKDPKRAVQLIGKTALLEFKMLDEEHSPQDAEKGSIPPGTELLYETETDPVSGRVSKTPYLVKRQTMLTGDLLTDAMVELDTQFNRPYVSIEFDKRGARIFSDVTGENVGKRMAIILDGNVYSAPVIQEKIPDGRARITGQFSDAEARDLAIVLRAGALPAPVEIQENRTVGPSLGADLIRRGMISIAISMALTMIFMLVYYSLTGLVANLALVMNLFIILAALAAFKAALTMPGIAALVLTVGMAVDANVLINERIREEQRAGRGPAAAVDTGYARAFSAILDSNVTTIISALVLWVEGTGPIRGFAVVLTIGLLSSMFTAIFMTRIIMDFFLFQRKITKLSI
jgi:preprotein translocase subunit SecD